MISMENIGFILTMGLAGIPIAVIIASWVIALIIIWAKFLHWLIYQVKDLIYLVFHHRF